MSNLILQKEFPEDYSNDILKVLKNMSFTDSKKLLIFGSMSIRSQLYAGDYDGYEIVENDGKTKEGYMMDLVNQFKKNVKDLDAMPLTYIGDIKCGEIKDWKILSDDIEITNGRVINYDAQQSKKNLEYLYKSELIQKAEYDDIYNKLHFTISPKQYFELKELCKYHIIRWKPEDILKGYKILLDGSKYYLREGLSSNSITKMDVISWINGNRFTDFSVIYQFNFNGKPINRVIKDITKSLKDNILAFYIEGEYFKMLKRIFAYSKLKEDLHMIEKLSDFFNSDIGIIYQIIGDIKTLEYIVENENSLPMERIKFEIDHFKTRLSNVILSKFLVERTKILGIINQLNKINKLQKADLLQKLRKLRNYLEKLLNYYTRKFIQTENIDIKFYLP